MVGLELGLIECKLCMLAVMRDMDGNRDGAVEDVGDVINMGGFSLDSQSSGGKWGTVKTLSEKSLPRRKIESYSAREEKK